MKVLRMLIRERSRHDTKPYDAGQGWSVSMTKKPCKKLGI